METNHRFPLGGSQCVSLLTIDSPDERRFFEIGATANPRSACELERQISSSLYLRLVLSRDKEEIHRLATDDQIVEKAADLIKSFKQTMRGLAQFRYSHFGHAGS